MNKWLCVLSCLLHWSTVLPFMQFCAVEQRRFQYLRDVLMLTGGACTPSMWYEIQNTHAAANAQLQQFIRGRLGDDHCGTVKWENYAMVPSEFTGKGIQVAHVQGGRRPLGMRWVTGHGHRLTYWFAEAYLTYSASMLWK